MEILGYKQYYEEAVDILGEIAKVFDANLEVRCQSERQRLLEIVKYAKSQSDYNHRAWEGFRKDAEHFRDEAKAYEAKWRAVLEKYESIRDTDWYTKIKDQEKQIDCQKDTIGRQLSEIRRLQELNGSHAAKISTFDKAFGDAQLKIAELRERIGELEEKVQSQQYVIDARNEQINDLKEENRKLKEDSQLTIKNGDTMLVRVRSYDELKRDIAQNALAVVSLKTENDILKNKLKEIENIVKELK